MFRFVFYMCALSFRSFPVDQRLRLSHDHMVRNGRARIVYCGLYLSGEPSIVCGIIACRASVWFVHVVAGTAHFSTLALLSQHVTSSTW